MLIDDKEVRRHFMKNATQEEIDRYFSLLDGIKHVKKYNKIYMDDMKYYKEKMGGASFANRFRGLFKRPQQVQQTEKREYVVINETELKNDIESLRTLTKEKKDLSNKIDKIDKIFTNKSLTGNQKILDAASDGMLKVTDRYKVVSNMINNKKQEMINKYSRSIDRWPDILREMQKITMTNKEEKIIPRQPPPTAMPLAQPLAHPMSSPMYYNPEWEYLR